MNNSNDKFICYVEGVNHYVINNEYPAINETLVLIPEPNNKFDKNCIGVYNVYLKKIGNIPKRANSFIGDKIFFKPAFAKVKSVYNDLHTLLIEISFSKKH
jgi:hypothetical protein